MSTPFVSSLRTSLGATGSSAMVSPAPGSTASKSAMASLFSSLDLALDASGGVVSTRSAAKDLLASKTAEKQAEEQLAAAHALKKQQKQQKQHKEEPVTALSQALGLFDQELEQRESFVSRATKRRQKGKKTRGPATTPARGRRQRQDKYKRV